MENFERKQFSVPSVKAEAYNEINNMSTYLHAIAF